MKKVILFGAGKIGKDALDFFGAENIAYFCSNNCDEDLYYGKSIINYEHLLRIRSNYIIVISMNMLNSDSVIEQLESDEVYDYVPFLGIKGIKTSLVVEGQAFVWINDEKNIYVSQANYFKNRNRISVKQLKYIKDKADITSMKPASGNARKRQLDLMQLSDEFMVLANNLNISPFLVSGNLIGAYRHKGFIPWDDDMDFGLMRKDFQILINYFKDTNRCFYCDRPISEQSPDNKMKYYRDILARYPKEMVLDINHGRAIILKLSEESEMLWLDFFPFDFFNEKYKLEDYQKRLIDRKRILEFDKYIDVLRYLEKDIRENEYISMEYTNHIYGGIDNQESHYSRSLKRKTWIEGSDVFPLKETEYEGRKMLVPNNELAFLTFEYSSDIMCFPDDIGIDKHSWLGDYIFE